MKERLQWEIVHLRQLSPSVCIELCCSNAFRVVCKRNPYCMCTHSHTYTLKRRKDKSDRQLVHRESHHDAFRGRVTEFLQWLQIGMEGKNTCQIQHNDLNLTTWALVCIGVCVWNQMTRTSLGFKIFYIYIYNSNFLQSTAQHILKYTTLCFHELCESLRVRQAGDFNDFLFLRIVCEGIGYLKLQRWQHGAGIALPNPCLFIG